MDTKAILRVDMGFYKGTNHVVGPARGSKAISRFSPILETGADISEDYLSLRLQKGLLGFLARVLKALCNPRIVPI